MRVPSIIAEICVTESFNSPNICMVCGGYNKEDSLQKSSAQVSVYHRHASVTMLDRPTDTLIRVTFSMLLLQIIIMCLGIAGRLPQYFRGPRGGSRHPIYATYANASKYDPPSKCEPIDRIVTLKRGCSPQLKRPPPCFTAVEVNEEHNIPPLQHSIRTPVSGDRLIVPHPI